MKDYEKLNTIVLQILDDFLLYQDKQDRLNQKSSDIQKTLITILIDAKKVIY